MLSFLCIFDEYFGPCWFMYVQIASQALHHLLVLCVCLQVCICVLVADLFYSIVEWNRDDMLSRFRDSSSPEYYDMVGAHAPTEPLNCEQLIRRWQTDAGMSKRSIFFSPSRSPYLFLSFSLSLSLRSFRSEFSRHFRRNSARIHSTVKFTFQCSYKCVRLSNVW